MLFNCCKCCTCTDIQIHIIKNTTTGFTNCDFKLLVFGELICTPLFLKMKETISNYWNIYSYTLVTGSYSQPLQPVLIVKPKSVQLQTVKLESYQNYKVCTIILQWKPNFTIVDLTINLLCPSKCYSKLYGAESRFNNIRFNDIPGITMEI